MVWKHRRAAIGAAYDREQRLTVPLGGPDRDDARPCSIVRTGELLEASTYYPNGARETFLNDDCGADGAGGEWVYREGGG